MSNFYNTENIANKGRSGDITIRKVNGEDSHVNEFEAILIDTYGKTGEKIVSKIGSGTINPNTGMKEYFDPLTLAISILAPIAIDQGMKWWGGSDRDPYTDPYQYKDKGFAKGVDLTDWDTVKDLFSGQGKFKGKNISDVLQDLKVLRSGQGATEQSGKTWSDFRPGAELTKFNPLKALSQKMKPFIEKNRAQIEGASTQAQDAIKKMIGKFDFSDVAVGKKDVWSTGGLEEKAIADASDRRMQSGIESGQQEVIANLLRSLG
jgi:hypothetical protein